MTGKALRGLAAVTAGLVLLLIVMRGLDGDRPTAAGQLLPALETIADSLTEVRVDDGDDATTLRQSAPGRWVVAERNDYPANTARLRQLVVALAGAAIVEEKTSNPALYGKLGLGEPGDESAGTFITFAAPAEEQTVVLGDSARRDNRYARVAGRSATYLIDANPETPAGPADWLLPDIVDVPASDIAGFTIEHGDGERIEFAKDDPEQADFEPANLPEGRELTYPSVANAIAGTLAGLTLTDVRPQSGAEPAATVHFRRRDGSLLRVDVIRDEDDEAWLALSADSAGADASASTDAINERVSGWEYRVPDYKARQLTKRWDDLLKAE